jgi:hypothetical protein
MLLSIGAMTSLQKIFALSLFCLIESKVGEFCKA